MPGQRSDLVLLEAAGPCALPPGTRGNELVRKGPHAADELPKLLSALGIKADDLARIEPMVLHDMERVCTLCNHKRGCDRDLAAGTSAEHYEEYCANASTIAGLGNEALK
jgi:hypothetical protein